MKKSTMLKIVNVGLGILFINQIITGMLADVMDHETFELLHVWIGGLLFILFTIAHIILNWGWVKSNFFKNKEKNRRECTNEK